VSSNGGLATATRKQTEIAIGLLALGYGLAMEHIHGLLEKMG
jgi:hypothetical protein